MMTTGNSTNLIRSELWSSELKTVLEEDLMAAGYVRMLSDFPDGDTFNIPSIGAAQADDYVEDSSIKYRPMDTGNFEFSIDEYVSSGHYITKKNEQDAFYSGQLISNFVPSQSRAIMEHFEANVLNKAEAILGATANDDYQINGAKHRYAGGNSGAIEARDFAYAWAALDKANVPAEGRIAIVDHSTAFKMNTLTNLVDVSNNKAWEGIIADGISSGMRFVKNVYGFDVYMSNYLPTVTDNALDDIDGNAIDFSSTAAKSNLFFSASSEVVPFVGAWRQAPTVDSEWDMDNQRTKYATTARYGVKLYRPENMVSVVATSALV